MNAIGRIRGGPIRSDSSETVPRWASWEAKPAYLRRTVVGGVAALLATSGLLAASLPTAGSAQTRTAGGTQPPGGLPPATRPLAANQVEAFAEGKVVVLTYPFSYYCPTESFADLNPPNNNGNGVPAASDPIEFQLPQCVFGDTGTGSVPTVGPNGEPIAAVAKQWGIVPHFDGLPLHAVFSNTPLGVQTQCPQPGPPVTAQTGLPGTCTMHPSLLHLGHVDLVAGLGLDTVPSPGHSHIVERTSSPATWWWNQGVLVKDRSIWPDFAGNCPAGREHCLTSVAALRAAQAKGQASEDIPSNYFLFFDVRPEVPQPDGSAPPQSEAGAPPASVSTGSPTSAVIQDFAFLPARIDIPSGTTLRWTNDGPSAHTVTSAGNLFDSGTLGPDDDFSTTFGEAGTFDYFCKLHRGMSGQVIVAEYGRDQARAMIVDPGRRGPGQGDAAGRGSTATAPPAPRPSLETDLAGRAVTSVDVLPSVSGNARRTPAASSNSPRSEPAEVPLGGILGAVGTAAAAVIGIGKWRLARS